MDMNKYEVEDLRFLRNRKMRIKSQLSDARIADYDAIPLSNRYICTPIKVGEDVKAVQLKIIGDGQEHLAVRHQAGMILRIRHDNTVGALTRRHIILRRHRHCPRCQPDTQHTDRQPPAKGVPKPYSRELLTIHEMLLRDEMAYNTQTPFERAQAKATMAAGARQNADQFSPLSSLR